MADKTARHAGSGALIRNVAITVGLALAGCEQPAPSQTAKPVANLETSRQFNLVCVGELKSFYGEKRRYQNRTIVIDLDKNAYCYEDCRNIEPIGRVEVGVLYLYQRPDESGLSAWVNRTSGEIIERFKMEGVDEVVYRGMCQKAPFTGFPAAKF